MGKRTEDILGDTGTAATLERCFLADWNHGSTVTVGPNQEQLHFPNLVSSIQQETSESVIVAAVITEETSDGQVDGHLVSSIQVEGNNNSGAVLLVLHIFFSGSCHQLAVNLQTGAGGQAVTRRTGVTVDGEGEAVDTRAWNSEDSGVHTVAVSQVDENVFVDDELVVTVGAKAVQTVFTG